MQSSARDGTGARLEIAKDGPASPVRRRHRSQSAVSFAGRVDREPSFVRWCTFRLGKLAQLAMRCAESLGRRAVYEVGISW